jgi:hypothetical protein
MNANAISIVTLNGSCAVASILPWAEGWLEAALKLHPRG